ncbi:TPA: hypothetical protein JG946_003762 [Enterobacter hormaechei subsp. steigerwaltii]|nr:hypothetical protein [Enterobacter hormaechei subsp. steigerwaltii]
MARNNDIRVDLEGDASGLKRALREGTDAIDDFGSNAGGVVGDVADQVTGLAGKFGTAMGGVAAGAAVGIGGITALIKSSNDYVREMNEVSRSTGLSVVQLQQLGNAFSGLGLQMDKFGDFNKDTLDKLGDAFRAGGGVSDDLKEYGLNLQDYNKYLKQADGGMQAVIHTFYAMRDAGKSQGEIVNVMESLASDSSHMISTLQNFNSESEAMTYIQSQNAAVSNEAAEKYAEFDKNLTQLTTNIKGTIADGLTPLVNAMNGVYDAANQKPHEAGLFEDLNKRIKESKGSLQDMLDIWEKLRMAGALNYQGAALHTGSMDNGKENQYAQQKKNLENLANQLKGDLAVVTAPKGGWEDTGKKADAAAKAAAAAAKKMEAERKAAAQKELTARRNLDNALAQIGEDSFKIRLQQFERQQKALMQTIEDSAKALGISPAELKQYKDAANASAATKRNDLINSAIGYSDPNQSLKDTNGIIGSGVLNDQQKAFLANQQNQRINGNNPFTSAFGDNVKSQLADNNAAMQEELKQNDLLLQGHEDYEKRKQEITAKYNAQAMTIAQQQTQAQLQLVGGMAGDMGNILAGAFGESSKAAQAAFAVQKGITMAQTVLSIQSALAQALATPFPASLAAYAQVLSLGASIISTAKGASSGQFHGGIDSVPDAYNNKSFLLKSGERVVQPESNKKLTAFLNNQAENGYNRGGDTTIYSPLIVKGNVDDPEMWNKMLKKNQANVAQAVKSNQKRNT